MDIYGGRTPPPGAHGVPHRSNPVASSDQEADTTIDAMTFRLAAAEPARPAR
jgi:hypothetical protein